jgi:NAD(P)-dependent dehydrogenase (short-subunit alcohol dehydrogenase family)
MPLTTTVITGATSGIGKETAMALALKDHAIYMLVRDMGKGEELRQEIITATRNKNVYVIHCDLADLDSVRNAADTLKAALIAVNVLINNAGGIFPQREVSNDGYEMTFAVNHLSHFLLFNEILPLLQKGHARVINVSSEAHRIAKPNFEDLQLLRRPYSAWTAYGNAKLFNIYFTRSIATRFGPKGISSFALHPGLVNTGFGTGLTGFGKFLLGLARPFMISAESGAQTTIYLATTARIESKSGYYFKRKKVGHTSAAAVNEFNRNHLWDLSMKLVQPFLN